MVAPNIRTEADIMSQRRQSAPGIEYYRNRRRTPGVNLLCSFDFTDKDVLEIGACHAFLSYVIRCDMHMNARIVVTDIFSSGFPEWFPGAVADKENLPFKNDTFDYVVCNDVLHHGYLDGTMVEVHRVLRPGGMFISTEEPCISSAEDELSVLRRDCSREIEMGIVERRPNYPKYNKAMRPFSQHKILSGRDLSMARDMNYGGHGVIIIGYK